MNPQKLDHLKKSLTERLAAAQSGLVSQSRSLLEEESPSLGDASDYATHETNRMVHTSLHNRSRHSVRDLKTALQRMEDGDFGICENCGDEIGEKRLLAQPTTLLCLICQEEIEKENGRF